ncbi:MAG TPA: HIT family protein [Candidatus Saccharimonadales bacterium]|nr:HIT family protein [Candidatus Saccharimonadales bacterium]
MREECAICNGKADGEFRRVEVWSNERWRLTMSTYRAVRGFCYLEPRRHIPHITELDGTEAAEFGLTLAKAARAIKSATNAKLVYVNIYGDHVPHLHVHLAPHTEGDIYANDVVRSDIRIDETVMKSEDVLQLSNEVRGTFATPTATN